MIFEDLCFSEVIYLEFFFFGVECMIEEQKWGNLCFDVLVQYMLSMFILFCMYWYMVCDIGFVYFVGDFDNLDEEYLQSLFKIFFDGVCECGLDVEVEDGCENVG